MVLFQAPKMLLELVLFEGAAVAWGVWQLWQVRPRRADKPADAAPPGDESPGAPPDPG
jgi:hypothetical protein